MNQDQASDEEGPYWTESLGRDREIEPWFSLKEAKDWREKTEEDIRIHLVRDGEIQMSWEHDGKRWRSKTTFVGTTFKNL